ncbi:unnamed protein product [Prunus armeniaca]
MESIGRVPGTAESFMFSGRLTSLLTLAKMRHAMEMGIHCFVLPLGGITSVLQEDRDDILRSRLIYV